MPGNPDAWGGDIDDFKIWNTALTPEQIQSVYEGDNNVERANLALELTFNQLDNSVDSIFDSNKSNLIH